ncbi:BspA family leucine-rich repeat surface protein, partial [Salmonella enterica subsp. enterica serovar Corvallis]|nr:BspA family leucine-rich repeat surface protein [Salmonella enterica subsp. enterica serovar Corvallis]
MKLKQSWKDELLALVNSKNSLQLTLDDVKFELTEPVSEVPGTVVVTIKPNDASRYFNEQSLTYVRRDIAKNFTGIPLRVIVKNDTAVRDIINTIAERYGLVFDTTIDFLESELNKQITFADTGIKDITVPVANTSYVWAGNLQFNIANDTLSLITIIKQTNLTNLVYLDGVESNTSGSLLLATTSVIGENGNAETTEGVLDAAYFQNILNVMVRYGDITSEQMQQAMQTINGSEDARRVEVRSYGDAELLVTTKKDWVIGSLKGAMVVGHASPKPIQYVLKTKGGSIILSLDGWTNVNIDWGDGNKTTETSGDNEYRHTYAAGTTERTIVATGTPTNVEDTEVQQSFTGGNISEIVDWNNGLPKAPSFLAANRLTKVPDYIPAYWTSLEGMFTRCTNINDVNITKWNTSNITSMKDLFYGCVAFNQPIGSWDVSSVKNIDNMLSGCFTFNQDLSGWTFPAGTSYINYDVSTVAWQFDYKPHFTE